MMMMNASVSSSSKEAVSSPSSSSSCCCSSDSSKERKVCRGHKMYKVLGHVAVVVGRVVDRIFFILIFVFYSYAPHSVDVLLPVSSAAQQLCVSWNIFFFLHSSRHHRRSARLVSSSASTTFAAVARLSIHPSIRPSTGSTSSQPLSQPKKMYFLSTSASLTLWRRPAYMVVVSTPAAAAATAGPATEFRYRRQLPRAHISISKCGGNLKISFYYFIYWPELCIHYTCSKGGAGRDQDARGAKGRGNVCATPPPHGAIIVVVDVLRLRKLRRGDR